MLLECVQAGAGGGVPHLHRAIRAARYEVFLVVGEMYGEYPG